MFRISILSFFALLCVEATYSQEKETFRVMFWNVENLFDTEKDSLKQDGEFTPLSMRAWNYTRYKRKMANVGRVITAVGEWEPPALVGLCEVENDNVLRYLTKYSPLKRHQYRYVMTESDDLRGIDVALLYQRDRFRLLEHRSIKVDLGENERPTRDILHVTGLVPTGDTLDVMVAHFPSRSGGKQESEHRRVKVAQVLKNVCDSLMGMRLEPRIFIMGDFNDYPEDKSIKRVLNVKLPDAAENDATMLYHLLARKVAVEKNKRRMIVGNEIQGSYKYQGEWGLLDHLLVSGLLLNSGARISTNERCADVVCLPFLLTEDEKFGGQQPFRTYHGMRYLGGYSDHLPIKVDFELLF